MVQDSARAAAFVEAVRDELEVAPLPRETPQNESVRAEPSPQSSIAFA
jgi:hypothetical protein